MLPQKIHIIPAVQYLVPSEPGPLVFWKKIEQNHEGELHLFLLLEGRTEKETRNLARDFWERISAYLNELVINQKGFSNPEYVCEAILKIGNDFLTSWSHSTQINNWSDLNLIIAVLSPVAIHFARLGKARLFLFRNKQIILADENLSHPRSPQFSPPFSELAGGPLRLGDRIILVSAEITESFSWEEIASLANPPAITQAFYNVLRSLEVAPISKNSAFVLGDVAAAGGPAEQEKSIYSLLGDKLKDARIGEISFLEFNPLAQRTAVEASSQTSIPWHGIIETLWSKTTETFELFTKIIAVPFGPVSRKIKSLSPTRKVILFSSFGLFLVFSGIIAHSLLNKQPAPSATQIDYKAAIEEAGRLKDGAKGALIYQDEEKARKSLMQADALLEQASSSGEWGIKAIKLRQEVNDQLSILDKTSPTEIQKIWTIPENQGTIKNIIWESNRNILAVADKGVWEIKTNGAVDQQAEKFSKELDLGENKYWIAPSGSKFLLFSPQNKSLLIITAASKEISEKKELSSEIKSSFSAAAVFDSSIYFFDSEGVKIKQFSGASDNLTFSRDWLKQDLATDFKDDPAVSMSIDGNIFLVTGKGNLFRLSGGKKISWNAEKPGSSFQGDNLVLDTKPEYKNLYLLDPTKKRIIIFEKETGKLIGQTTNNGLSQAVGFQVDEKNKTVYFATGNNLFKLALSL